MTETRSKCLIFRLSSLGDVILASVALTIRPGADWVVAQAFSEPIEGHPGLGKIWIFDPQSGFWGWARFCRELWKEGYSEVFDLHGSLRTRLARFWFGVLDFLAFFRLQTQKSPEKKSSTRWKVAPKQRLRVWGYFCFKRFWPARWRPDRRVEVFARTLGGQGTEHPHLEHLLSLKSSLKFEIPEWPKPYLCVMPSSKWKGKEWPVERYVELLERLKVFAVVLGTSRDRASVQLSERLTASGIPHFSAVGKYSLAQVAMTLKGARAYLGSDTGIGHLAEAVGTPAWVVFGPTSPQGGFGPWHKQSLAIGSSLSCRPCSKDGESCFRLQRKYLCMTSLTAREVQNTIVHAGKSP